MHLGKFLDKTLPINLDLGQISMRLIILEALFFEYGLLELACYVDYLIKLGKE